MNPATLMAQYNRTRAWARRTQIIDPKRVDRAFGLAQTPARLLGKLEVYGTRLDIGFCGCADHEYRTDSCKHLLALRLLENPKGGRSQ